MDIKTTGNKILIEVEKKSKEPEESKTGILLASPSAEKSSVINAKVLGIGRDVKEVQVGDRVVVEKMTTQKFTLDGEEYRIVPEPSVLGYKSSKDSSETLQSINEGDEDEQKI